MRGEEGADCSHSSVGRFRTQSDSPPTLLRPLLKTRARGNCSVKYLYCSSIRMFRRVEICFLSCDEARGEDVSYFWAVPSSNEDEELTQTDTQCNIEGINFAMDKNSARSEPSKSKVNPILQIEVVLGRNSGLRSVRCLRGVCARGKLVSHVSHAD